MPNPAEVTPNLPLNPTPKPSNLVLKLLVVVALAAVAGGLFLLIKQFNIFPLFKTNTPSPSTTPTPVSTPTPNVLYPQNYDPTGRNVYFQTDENNSYIPFTGAGVHTIKEGTQFTNEEGKGYTITNSNMIDYIVGSFVKWENIEGSNDKYMVLNLPFSAKDETGKETVIPRVRVGFNPKNNKNDDLYMTRLFIQDLSTVIPAYNGKVETYFLGTMSTLTDEQVEKVIRSGDVIGIQLYVNFTISKNELDNNNNIIASGLNLRRFNALTEVKQEANLTVREAP